MLSNIMAIILVGIMFKALKMEANYINNKKD